MKRWLTPLVACVALALTGSAAAAASTVTSHDPVPHCQHVLFDENSGNGPNYHITVCGNQLAKPATGELQFIVDGSPLQNGAVVFINHVSGPQPTPSPSNSGTVAPTAPRTAASGYKLPPDPRGPDWPCIEYGHLYSWDCITKSGFLYGGMWAFVSDFYEHPNPSTDYVVNETYFNQNGLNGMTKTAQWRHRVITVNDAAVQGVVMPLNWRVSAGNNNPPAPTTCLVLTGNEQGQQIACDPLVQQSILDYWHRASEIPNQDAW